MKRDTGAAILPSHLRAIGDIIASRPKRLCADLCAVPKVRHRKEICPPSFHSCKNLIADSARGGPDTGLLEQAPSEIRPFPTSTSPVPPSPRGPADASCAHQTVATGNPDQGGAAQSIIELGSRAALGIGGNRRRLGRPAQPGLNSHPPAPRSAALSGPGTEALPMPVAAGIRRENFPVSDPALGQTGFAPLTETAFSTSFGHQPAPHTWRTPWVVHITPWSEERRCSITRPLCLQHRASTDRRIVAVDEAGFLPHRIRRPPLPPNRHPPRLKDFMRRFLQHVLPQGLHTSCGYSALWPAQRQPVSTPRNGSLARTAVPASPHTPTTDEAAVSDTRHCRQFPLP